MTQHDSIILEIKVMRNMALIFGEMEQYQEAIVLLKKVIQLSKEMDYGQMISTAFSQIAWNMMHQIENGERDMSDIVRVKHIRGRHIILLPRGMIIFMLRR